MKVFVSGWQEFQTAVHAMADENPTVGVKPKPPGHGYAPIHSGEEFCLDYGVSILPPNYFFLPPGENLFQFRLGPPVAVKAAAEKSPVIVCGIHPFDLHAFKTLDVVFLRDPVDRNYQARREAAVFIGVDCLHPWAYSFAASMGTALPPETFDLWLTPMDDAVLVEVGSKKGAALFRKYIRARQARKAEIGERERLRNEALGRYRLALRMSPREVPAALDSGWESPLWDELGRKCFACGSCTMVCPTCVCFDVQDRLELSRTEGERYRNPDSCMFIGFDRLGSGESFRRSGPERLRHRLHRKGKYMLQRWGELGCVGCGRCVHACLVDIASPVKAYNRLWEEMEKERKSL